MPGRDGTGPMGQGPNGFRGRSGGRCVGPNQFFGQRGRNSTWQGGGRGINRPQRVFRNWNEPIVSDIPDTQTNQEIDQLHNEIQALKQAISDLTAVVNNNQLPATEPEE